MKTFSFHAQEFLRRCSANEALGDYWFLAAILSFGSAVLILALFLAALIGTANLIAVLTKIMF